MRKQWHAACTMIPGNAQKSPVKIRFKQTNNNSNLFIFSKLHIFNMHFLIDL